MRVNRSTDFKQTFDELKVEYIRELPLKIKNLEELLEHQNQDGLYEKFHRLKGSGATYGCPEISMLGEVMENLYKKNPFEFKKMAPLSLDILRAINKERLKEITEGGYSYKIEKDPRFSKLQALV